MDSNIIGIFLAEGDEIVEANDTYLRMTGYMQENLPTASINWAQMIPLKYSALAQQAQRMLPWKSSREKRMYNLQQAHSDFPPIKRILIVEDDPALGNVLREARRHEPPNQ